MGNIRTPKPHYFDGGIVEFYVKNKEQFYKTILWNKDGLKQYIFETGRFDGKLVSLDDIVERGLRSFSSVGVIEK